MTPERATRLLTPVVWVLVTFFSIRIWYWRLRLWWAYLRWLFWWTVREARYVLQFTRLLLELLR